MPPAMAGHRLVCLPSAMSRRPMSSPVLGSMLFTKLMFCTSCHTFTILASAAVVDEDVPALVRMDDQLLAVPIDHHELTDGAVEVPGVVRQLLVIELQPAGVGIERDDRGGVEVVARPWPRGLPVGAGPVVERRRVARAPPHRVRLGVIGAGHPAAATTGPPRVAAPRLHALVGAGHREELPDLAAAGGIDAEDRAAARPLTALGADDDLVLDQQGRTREADGELLGVDQLRVPRPAGRSSGRWR